MTWIPNKAPERRSKTKTDPSYSTNRRRGSETEGRFTVGNVCQEELFRDTIAALERAGHELCVLHGYEEYPEHISSDVDALSLNPTQIPYILSKHHSADPISIVQVLQHETSAFSYALYRNCGDKPAFLSLDVCSDYRCNGRIFFRGEEFLEASKPFKFFNASPPELEFAYYLIKKVAKSSLSEAHALRLSRLYNENPAGCEQQLVRFFPREEAEFIAEAARSGDWKPVRSRIEELRPTMLSKLRRERPLRVFRYWLGDLRRRAKRVLQPTGLMVVFLGADGSGKSTVIERVEQDLVPIFRRTTQYHLRPQVVLGRTGTGPVTNPHAQLPRGKVASLAKLGLWGIDYTVGYLANIFPKLVRSTLVLFDRYYHDLLVDTRRYRYRGWLWPVRLVGWFIPRPHLLFLLDAPPKVLQARKQEVSFEEATRQREEYLKLARNSPNGHVVDASKPLDEVVAEIERIILGYMAKRTARRLGLS